MAIKIYSGFNKPKGVAQTFEKVSPVYDLVIDKVTGKTDVKIVGQKDTYAEIQEANVGLSVQDFLNEYAIDPITGLPKPLDTSKLNYLDNYSLPKSMLEAHRVVFNAKQDFEKLPVEVRNNFKNDFGQFLAYIDANGGIENVKAQLKKGELKEKFLADREAKKQEIKLKAQLKAEIEKEGK